MFWKAVAWYMNRSQPTPPVPKVRRPPAINRGGTPLLPVEYTADYVRGYRWWQVVPDDDGTPVLRSLHYSYNWRMENTAECRVVSHPVPEHRAPDVDCFCGLYAQRPDRPIRDWAHLGEAQVHASGSILMSGRIIVCEAGFKAEHALLESPVLIVANCEHGCSNPVEYVQPPSFPYKPVWAFCGEHLPPNQVAIEAVQWMRHTIGSLEQKYPNVEFMSPLLMEAF